MAPLLLNIAVAFAILALVTTSLENGVSVVFWVLAFAVYLAAVYTAAFPKGRTRANRKTR